MFIMLCLINGSVLPIKYKILFAKFFIHKQKSSGSTPRHCIFDSELNLFHHSLQLVDNNRAKKLLECCESISPVTENWYYCFCYLLYVFYVPVPVFVYCLFLLYFFSFLLVFIDMCYLAQLWSHLFVLLYWYLLIKK